MKRKYVKDYAEKESGQKLPGRKKEYIYTGNYFVRTYAKNRKSMLISYCVSTAVLAVLWLFRGMINSEGTHFALIALPYTFELIALVYLCRGIFCCFAYSSDRLERFQYEESVQRIIHSTIVLLLLEIIAVIGEAVFLIINKESVHWGNELLFLAGTLISVVFVCYLQKVSKQNPCTEEKKSQI